MIAVSIATGALGVAQTWLSNVVGQRVMHDLRSAVYRHLQRLSLAFFTRTRTGEVQSRIANDIGGVQNVVTSTATSIVSNVTTVIAVDHRDDRCSTGGWPRSASALLPFFVWLTRRVGAGAQADHHRAPVAAGRHELAGRGVAVASRASCSARRWAAARSSPRASATSRRELADLEVRSRMAGRWRMAVGPDELRHDAGARLLVRRARRRARSRSAPSSRSRRCRRGCCSRSSRCCRSASTCRPRGALFARIFEYLDLPVDVARGRRAELPTSRGDVRVRGRHVRLRPRRRRRRCADVDIDVPAGTRTAMVGETGSGKTTLGYLVARLYDAAARPRHASTASTCAT